MKNRPCLIMFVFGIIVLISVSCSTAKDAKEKVGTRWSVEKVQIWGEQNPWFVGANFIPSTAINSLEMWQAETFDPATIDRELGWASNIGFNMMRVWLHHVAWKVDPEDFKTRIDEYLTISDKHNIKTMFVFFCDCWNAVYTAGKQPEYQFCVHNPGWVQDPGLALYDEDDQVKPDLMLLLEEYVMDIISTFSNDERIAVWDLYNEPGASGYGNRLMVLLEQVFSWARKVNPVQPITVGV